jgi:hypothetical protein
MQERDFKKRLQLLSDSIPGLDPDAIFKNLLADLFRSETNYKLKLLEVVSEIRSGSL